ncbi:MAG: proton-conducting membrane transporter [Oscillospiraceae bacterium]|nr:proton-conducting membrane transporter [Oscillospiraceae bacterium]
MLIMEWNPLLLLVPILLPILCGGWLLLGRRMDSKNRELFTEVAACFTSTAVFLSLSNIRRGSVATVYTFIDGFSVGFMMDGPGMLFAGMVAVMWPLALLYAFSYMERAPRQNSFFAFYLMTYGVTLAVAFSANLVTMYVCFELLTLVTIPLVAHSQNTDSTYAGYLYAAYCIAGAALALVAVVLGTLDGSGTFHFGGNLANEYPSALMRTVYLFGFIGFGTKAAVFPLYIWLPKASVAPTPVTALLHAVAVVNSGVFAVTRLTWYAFGPNLLSESAVRTFCVLLSSFSMVFAAVMALKERHFKRRLAYSTMSNLSYMLFGVSLMTGHGLTGALSHMLFHGVIKMSLFLCAGAFMHVTGKEYLYEINGQGWRMPYTFTAYTLGALSLTGIPLFCGFVSKWRLLTAGVAAGTWADMVGVAALLLSAFLCAMYTLSVSVRAFLPRTPDSGAAELPAGIQEADWRMLVPIGFFTAANIAFGVWSKPVMTFLEAVSRGVL